MPEGGQAGGEAVGLLGCERGEGERVGPTRSPSLGPGELHDVRAGPRAQEVSGSGKKAVDVLGEVPVIRSHAS